MKQPNKNDYFIDIDSTEILPYAKAYRAYKKYADDLEDYIKHLNQAKNNEVLDIVSDSVCSNCDGYGYTIDENGRRKEHCDKC